MVQLQCVCPEHLATKRCSLFFFLSINQGHNYSSGDKGKERQRERDKERIRGREGETETETDRERERERERETDREGKHCCGMCLPQWISELFRLVEVTASLRASGKDKHTHTHSLFAPSLFLSRSLSLSDWLPDNNTQAHLRPCLCRI